MKFIKWIKSHLSTIIYILCGFATIIASTSLVIWSKNGDKALDVNIISKEVVTNENTQREYLVGQKVNTDNLFLNIGNDRKENLIPASECKIESDFTSAGNKQITLSYEPNSYTSYQGKLDVKVHFVRNIIVKSHPKSINVDKENKTFSSTDLFDISAELATRPTTSDFEIDDSIDDKIAVKLKPEMYTTSVIESTTIEGFYSASLYLGNLTYSFNFYNNAGSTFYVSSEKDIVQFENVNTSSNSKLILVVTSRDSSYQFDCIGLTSGSYIYQNEKGEKEILDFSYELKEKEECFNSSKIEEIKDDSNSLYIAKYDNNEFKVQSNLWQSAVVNGLIYNDGGFNLVANSDSRILHMNYVSDNPSENDPEMTLYVTYYTFDTSTGSGKSYGFYLYKDSSGSSYKIPFFLQTFVWDHVPLSATIQNSSIDSTFSLGDWLSTKYVGDLFTQVRVFVRGEGWKEATFTASFDDWRLVAYNMA